MNVRDLPALIDRLGIVTARMHLPSAMASNQSAGGQLYRMGLGVRLWEGDISIRPYSHADASEIAALLERLDEVSEGFLIYNVPLRGPRADPTGSGLAGASPSIGGVDQGDMRKITLSGLPPGYAIRTGDMLSYQIGGIYGLHRVYSGGSAGVGGALTVDLTHPVMAGTAGQAVELVRPCCKAVLVPDSYSGFSFQAAISSGAALQWRQTLK